MITIRVCTAKCCRMRGSRNAVQEFQQLVEEYMLHDEIEVKTEYLEHELSGAEIMVSVNGEARFIQPENARAFFKSEILPMTATEKYMFIDLRVHRAAAKH